jgi:hypothetical protein
LGTRHVDPDLGCTDETTEMMVTPNQDIVEWRKRFYNEKLDKNSQGPFFAEDIHLCTQQTLSMGLSKRGKHKNNNNKTTCDVPTDIMSKLSVAQDFIRTPARMQHGFTNRIPPSKLTPGQT